MLSKLKGGEAQTVEMANAFQKRSETDYALSTYLQSRKLNGGNVSLYAIPLAQAYASKHDVKLMTEEYLNALKANPMLEEDIQGYLQLYMEEDADYLQIKNALLKKAKEFPEAASFTEMLIWLYVQRKDFDNAFIQAKSLDKRYREEGRRLVSLGQLAISNEKFDAAVSVFSYVYTTYTKDKPYYLSAKMGSLEARNKKVFYSGMYTDTDLKLLDAEYNTFLQEFGRYYFTAPAIREQAKLNAYYLHNYESAIALLKELIEMPRLDNRFKAECKLELGDIYVLKGEEWEGMLLYGQVDKEFLEDPLGQEAKFRNAKLSYYLGEFDWARAQLDVLKTATTQLIANNALELSLLISDNTIDSIEEPLQLYAKADLNYFQNNFTVSLLYLDSINELYPRHELDDDILYKRAQIYLKQRNYEKSYQYLDQILREHGSGILGDNALYMMTQIAENNQQDKVKALKLYEQFIEQYPGSFFLNDVRKRFRALRGDQLN